MLRVSIQHEDADGQITELAAMRISRIEPTYDEAEEADYQVELALLNVESTSVKSRYLEKFPRKVLTAVALVKHALNLFENKELTLDGDEAAHPAGRQHRGLRAIQGASSILRDYGPALRGGQSVEHGSDSVRKGARDEDPE